jgi:hypothetical protein
MASGGALPGRWRASTRFAQLRRAATCVYLSLCVLWVVRCVLCVACVCLLGSLSVYLRARMRMRVCAPASRSLARSLSLCPRFFACLHVPQRLAWH